MSNDIRTRRWGLTQQELADRLNVTKGTVCKWQTRRVPAERVKEVSAATGIPPHQLRPDLFEAA